MEDFKISSLSRPIHVYLSFKGDEETDQFTDRLWAALESNDLNTFWDDKKLEIENSINIPLHLVKAIQQSSISIVVFSKSSASSIWCLEELSEIATRINEQRHTILPVFYGVDLSENPYEKALAEYERRFTTNSRKVHRYRSAITQVANLPGWEICYDSGLHVIDDIVRSVKRKMRQLVYADVDLVGMQSRVEAVKKLLDLSSDDGVKLVGIYGMGGIGKTTLARVLYDRISRHFEASSFLPNVFEVFMRDGLCPLQQVHKILEMENLMKLKALIVLDGVDQLDLLLNPIPNPIPVNCTVRSNRLGRGSRILILTRNERVLKMFQVDDIYKVELLNEDEALQLFCKKAFKCDFPIKGYEEQTHGALQYVHGLPLAIVVYGSWLFNQSASRWRSVLCEQKKVPNYWIMEVLKTSFDELHHMNKEMFLDIACFFAGKMINYVEEILRSCGFSVETGIQLLIEKSLMNILDQRIQMHEMLQEMGREIIRKESANEPGERSRLWHFDDICHVMENDTATEKVQAIVLTLKDSKGATFRVEALSRMTNLRLLIFQNVKFFGSLKYLSSKLQYVSWHQYPFTSLPLAFQTHSLVHLTMTNSNVTKLLEVLETNSNVTKLLEVSERWNYEKLPRTGRFPMLRTLNLRGSKNLVMLPDFRETPILQRLDLEGCIGLLQLHPSVGKLSKLKILNLRNCINLVSIPNELFVSSSLETLNLACCSKLAHCLNFTPIKSTIEVKLLSNQYCQFLEEISYCLFFSSPKNKYYFAFVFCCLFYLICICEVGYS